jgi:DNA-binding NarL/FixJ family response regulator
VIAARENGPIRVVVADDHALIRAGVRALLGSIGEVILVGEAADGDEAIRVVAETRPDVVLMDVHMPGLDGVSATRTIVANYPEVAVLVVSMLEDDASVFAAMRAGARGYLLKGAEPDELRHAIAAVASGAVVFGPALASRVQRLFSSDRGATSIDPLFPELTQREHEVLAHLADGRSNAAIGAAMFLSSRTVANHVSNILFKLQATDRTDAALRARRAGLGDTPPK